MSPTARFALLAVVFVDLMGQGLIFPIVNELVMDPKLVFLPVSTSLANRHYAYGLVIGTFFLAWFLGAVYIARLSDTIGRKNAIMICLTGALIGYVITIASLFLDSLWLLIVGRAITGFTAGNQPIAQAAMIDGSRDNSEKARNMGYIVAGSSAGLVSGPIIGGILSDQSIIGSFASLHLPFYCAALLVVATMVLVQISFTDIRKTRKRLQFRPLEIFTELLRIREKPIVARLCPVYFCFMTGHVTFFIFMNNYLTSRFEIGLFGNSMVMAAIGFTVAASSTYFVSPVLERIGKRRAVVIVTIVMSVCALLFVGTAIPAVTYVSAVVYYIGFGIAYPALLGIFSASVSADEQGWVMGVTTAGFTLAAGIMSLAGGAMMAINIHLPYFLVSLVCVFALVLMRLLWNTADVERITR